MSLKLGLPAIGVLLLGSACTVRSYEYRTRPTAYAYTTPAETCSDPRYPCGNSYYWDEWRSVYVFYDGTRYYDALGTPGSYPLPPQNIVITYPPYGYVPPSAYYAPPNLYYPPRSYVSPPPDYHRSMPVPGGGSYTYVPPPRGSGINTAPPPV